MFTRYALVIGLLLSGVLAASDTKPLFADRLFDKKEFGWAYLEYERLMFGHPDSNALSSWKYRAGECKMETGNYGKAAELFSAVPADSRLRDSASLQAAVCEIRLNNLPAAKLHLSTCRLDYAKITEGYINFLSKDYGAALDTLKTVSDASPDAFKSRTLEKVILDAAAFKQKHYFPALALSVVPGLGHLYSKNYGDAAMTALTVATGAAITGYYAYYKSQPRAIAMGTITGLFYVGSMYGAVMSVKIYNRKTARNHRDLAERIYFGR
jgi:hypothetical protein